MSVAALMFNREPKPLPKHKLEKGANYVGVCRNANIARWDGEQFHHWRTKFGFRFLETIKHRDDDSVFDVFDAWMRVHPSEVVPIPIPQLDEKEESAS